MGDILNFPIKNNITPTAPVNKPKKKIKKAEVVGETDDRKIIDEILEFCSINMLELFVVSGIDITNEEFFHRFAYTMQVLQSTLFHTKNIPHVLDPHMKNVIDAIKKSKE